MILVTGAAGKPGKAVVKALAASGARVRALVRRAESGAAVKVMGAAEVAIGSFHELRRARLGPAAGAAGDLSHLPNVSRDELAFACAVVDRGAGAGRCPFRLSLGTAPAGQRRMHAPLGEEGWCRRGVLSRVT